MSSIEKVTKGATSVTAAVFISRILGLLREQVLAYFFGAGKAMDAFVVGYLSPIFFAISLQKEPLQEPL